MTKVWQNGDVAGAADLNRWESVQGLTADTGDQTAAINDWLADTSPFGIKQLIGTTSISAGLQVPAGTYFDISKAHITQLGDNKSHVVMGSNSTLYGGTLVGKGSDYVSGASGAGVGININGASNVEVNGTTVTNVSGHCINVIGATNAKFSRMTVVGVPDLITAGDGSPCDGFFIDNNSSQITIDDCNISGVCQGIIGGLTVTHLTITDTKIHDVVGQHGMYVQNGVGLHLSGLDIWNTNLDGCKVQIHDTLGVDAVGISISDITLNSVGSNGLILINTDTNLSGGWKFKAVTINNVSAVNCSRGVYLSSVWGADVSNISVLNCTGDAITVLDCQNIQGSNWVVDTAGRLGIRFTNQSGAATDRISLSGVRIHNAGNNGETSNVYGIQLVQGSNITLDRTIVTANNAKMQYGLYVASANDDQATLIIRNSEFSGATTNDVRLLTNPPRKIKEWNNVTIGSTISGFPVALPTKIGGRGANTMYVCNAAPTSGVFAKGDEILNSAGTVGQPKAWIVTTAGGASSSTRANSTAYTAGTWIKTSTGAVLECTTAGTTDTAEPTIGAVGTTVTDGSVIWTVRATTSAVLTSTGNL